MFWVETQHIGNRSTAKQHPKDAEGANFWFRDCSQHFGYWTVTWYDLLESIPQYSIIFHYIILYIYIYISHLFGWCISLFFWGSTTCHNRHHLLPPSPPVPGLARWPFPVAVPPAASVPSVAPWAAAPVRPAPPAAPAATEHLVKPVMGSKRVPKTCRKHERSIGKWTWWTSILMNCYQSKPMTHHETSKMDGFEMFWGKFAATQQKQIAGDMCRLWPGMVTDWVATLRRKSEPLVKWARNDCPKQSPHLYTFFNHLYIYIYHLSHFGDSHPSG